MRKNRKLTAVWICVLMAGLTVTGCTLPWQKSSAVETPEALLSDKAGSLAGTDLQLSFDEEDGITDWDESESTRITLSGNTADISGSGAVVNGQTVTITKSGTYVLTGTLTGGRICVNCPDKETVRLVLNGVDLSAADTAAILVEDAKKVLITVAENTVNTVSDSTRGSAADEDYSAAISAKADLVFNGTGSLTVNAGYRNGIKSSDDLKFVSGNYSITSVEDGLIGRDLLGILDGHFTMNAGTDGMKSTYDTDTEKGNIILNGGSYEITAANDGIQAENTLLISGGSYTVRTGGGAAAATSRTGGISDFGGRFGNSGNTAASQTDTDSCKGLKAGANIVITGGSYQLDCMDDAVHTNDTIQISGGTFVINTGDDGIHADLALQIDGGSIELQSCYEGLEAADIQINGGALFVTASDDGINAASKSSDAAPGMGGFNPGTAAGASDCALVIAGGEIFVNAGGDGLDSNGTVTVSGGQITVCGPTDQNNAALDFDGTFTITGGVLMAFGSSGMLETPTAAENGNCIVTTFAAQAAETEFVLTDSDGSRILSFSPVKAYESAIVYSPDIQTGAVYTVTAGSVSQTISVERAVTSNQTGGGMGTPGNGAPGGNFGAPGGSGPDAPGAGPGGAGRNSR